MGTQPQTDTHIDLNAGMYRMDNRILITTTGVN